MKKRNIWSLWTKHLKIHFLEITQICGQHSKNLVKTQSNSASIEVCEPPGRRSKIVWLDFGVWCWQHRTKRVLLFTWTLLSVHTETTFPSACSNKQNPSNEMTLTAPNKQLSIIVFMCCQSRSQNIYSGRYPFIPYSHYHFFFLLWHMQTGCHIKTTCSHCRI